MTNYMMKNRDPGWIELFFDLSFVVLVGEIAHLLFKTDGLNADFFNFISFWWLFGIITLVWMLFTVFLNYYGNNGVRQNLFAFILMICLLFISVLIEDFVENAALIAIMLGFMCVIISIVYFRATYTINENIAYVKYKRISLLVLALLTIPCVFFSPHIIMIYTSTIFLGEHLLDEIIAKKKGMASPDGSHFVERIGVFMILVFGEAFLTLIGTVDIAFDALPSFFILLFTIFALWINYFTFLDDLASVQYNKYSQILLNNIFIFLGMTMLSGIIYHGMHQHINVQQFELAVVIFTVLFFFANSISFKKIGCGNEAVWYGILPVLVAIISALFFNTHFSMLCTLFLIALGSAIFVLYQNKHNRKMTCNQSGCANNRCFKWNEKS